MVYKLVSVIALSVFVGVLVNNYKEDLFTIDHATRAFGELQADFGVSSKEPLFHTLSIASGESETRHISIVNESTQNKAVYLKGINQDKSTNTELLEIIIESEYGVIYGKGSSTGPKTLSDFFIESTKEEGILAGSIEPAKQKILFITVNFPEKTGHVKKQAVKFDLSLLAKKAD